MISKKLKAIGNWLTTPTEFKKGDALLLIIIIVDLALHKLVTH